jgi:Predicted transcriptional regulator
VLLDKEALMKKYKLGEMEQRLTELIWEKAPVSTRDLIVLCTEAFNWKRTTTYTMLKRLCDRELFVNDSGIVRIIVSKDDFLSKKGEAFLAETFDGSLPRFIAAFTRRRKLNEQEVHELQQLIDEYREE